MPTWINEVPQGYNIIDEPENVTCSVSCTSDVDRDLGTAGGSAFYIAHSSSIFMGPEFDGADLLT
jgi:hypothetical protein